MALLGAVDGGASDNEQVGEFGGAVLPGLEQADQMRFLPGVELGLLAAEPTLGLRYLHPFSGAQPDQVGLELRDHRQHVEQQPADRVVRIVDRGAETETDLPGGEFVGDRPRVGQRPGEAVELGHHQGVAFSAGRHRLPQAGPVSGGAGQAVIDVDPGRRDTQCGQAVVLGGEVLLVGGAACLPDEKRRHGAPPV